MFGRLNRMRTLFQACVLLAAAALAAPAFGQAPLEAPQRYDGHTVVRVEMQSRRDVQTLLALSSDPWTCGWDGVSPGTVDFRLDPEAFDALRSTKIPFRVLIPDVQKLIDAERRAQSGSPAVTVRGPGTSLLGDSWFQAFQPRAAVNAGLDSLIAARPTLASRVILGSTLEQRQIVGIRISSSSPSSGPKPSIVINGCQHAREWITVMAGMRLADRLLSRYDDDPRIRALVDAFDWSIIPITNPDGYEFTWTSQRLWRKNRRDNGDGSFGVDPNRNWDAGWNTVGASTNSSSDLYQGVAPFSEPETQALRDYLAAQTNLVFHCDVHSYSQLILWPRGDSFNLSPDQSTFERVGAIMQDAMYAVEQKIFSPGPIYRNIYPAGGGSCDWSTTALGVLGTSLELRDEGQFGFVLPADQIIPASEEAIQGLLAAAEQLITSPVDVEFIDGPPARVPVGGAATLRVRPLRGSARPSSAFLPVLWQRVGRVGPFSSASMLLAGSDESGPVFQASLSASSAPCGAVVQFYIEVPTVAGPARTVPAAGTQAPFEVPVHQFTTLAASNFDSAASATGWLTADPTAGSPDTAPTGSLWVRGDPNGTIAQPEFDHTPLSTGSCFYTGANARGTAGTGDIDSGKTTLVSPIFNLAAHSDVELAVWIWFSNNRGSPGSNDDSLAVDLTATAAQVTPTWVRALTLSSQAPIAQSTGLWRRYTIPVRQFVPLTSAFRMRVVAADLALGSIVEAAIDDFAITSLTCAKAPCDGDFNGLGDVTVQDIFDYLQAFFSGDPAADRTGVSGVTVEDLFNFLAAWFTSCP